MTRYTWEVKIRSIIITSFLTLANT
jgi:hypothetical protein